MNKIEILEALEEIDLPKEEYYILSGGCLVLYGLKENTNDLDLCVSKKAFEMLKEKFDFGEENKSEHDFYQINDYCEVIVKDKKDWKYSEIDGYQVEDLETLLAFKERRNMEKDKQDIINIRRYLNK
ncbi:MAG: hypothetical protein IKT41_00950 [Clostridia bacterium]|nr:hypothetical protein [Clostridia bacterium]